MTISQLLSRYYTFFACGDAVGKATEFMTPQDIRSIFGRITGLADISGSITHSDLPSWSVTDDTEQNLWLLRRWLRDGDVGIENTVDELVRWIEGTKAVEKKYIGPSSLKALESIKNGADPLTSGYGGSTCGGIMRVPAAVFASRLLGKDLDSCIYNALVCTHNNSVALESAYAYAYALDLALTCVLEGAEITYDKLRDKALEGCSKGISKAPWESASASLSARLAFIDRLPVRSWSEEEIKAFMYGVLGTGLPSYETSSAVFCMLCYTSDPVRIMNLVSETGGDTDTIAALACSLASLMDLDSTLPADLERTVVENNRLQDYFTI